MKKSRGGPKFTRLKSAEKDLEGMVVTKHFDKRERDQERRDRERALEREMEL